MIFIILSDILAFRTKTGGPLSFIQLDNGLKFVEDEKLVSCLMKMTRNRYSLIFPKYVYEFAATST